MNLLEETVGKLSENNLKPKDVRWVGTNKGSTTWKQFKKLADREYDDGFGGEEVNTELLVVGDDWWLERHEYDGSEWWEFKRLPQKPENKTFVQTGDKFNYDELFLYFL